MVALHIWWKNVVLIIIECNVNITRIRAWIHSKWLNKATKYFPIETRNVTLIRFIVIADKQNNWNCNVAGEGAGFTTNCIKNIFCKFENRHIKTLLFPLKEVNYNVCDNKNPLIKKFVAERNFPVVLEYNVWWCRFDCLILVI